MIEAIQDVAIGTEIWWTIAGIVCAFAIPMYVVVAVLFDRQNLD